LPPDPISGDILLMRAVPLTAQAYRDYGDVISARDDITPTSANLGTAQRYNHLTKLQNLRPGATANLCVFRCQPMVQAGERHFDVGLLERHAQSTQAFIPMHAAGGYLVVVSRGGERPEPATLQAFVASPTQGITYHPGIWHHPLVVLSRPADFACLVWEDGSDDDCEVVRLDRALRIEIR
jgi:ureidoglycolate lyase